jgi:hypothetical protein
MSLQSLFYHIVGRPVYRGVASNDDEYDPEFPGKRLIYASDNKGRVNKLYTYLYETPEQTDKSLSFYTGKKLHIVTTIPSCFAIDPDDYRLLKQCSTQT